MGEVQTLFQLTSARVLQLLQKIRRNLMVTHAHNKHLTIPERND